jgi:TolA-binding protein
MTQRLLPIIALSLLLTGCAAETAMDGTDRDALKMSVLELTDEVRQLRETVDALRADQQAPAMNRAMETAMAPTQRPTTSTQSTRPVGQIGPLTRQPTAQGMATPSAVSAPRPIVPQSAPAHTSAPPIPVAAPPIPVGNSSGGSHYGNLPDSLPPANSVDEAAAMLLPLSGGQAAGDHAMAAPESGADHSAAMADHAAATPTPDMPPAAAADHAPMTMSSADALLGDAANEIGIHLVSLHQQDSAERAWKELTTRYPDILGRLQHRISAIDFGDGRGTFYRVKAGPFADKASAEVACLALRTKGAYCAISDFLGS